MKLFTVHAEYHGPHTIGSTVFFEKEFKATDRKRAFELAETHLYFQLVDDGASHVKALDIVEDTDFHCVHVTEKKE